MNSGPPRISVVVPVRHAEPYIEACVASITAQHLRPLELVLVHDPSETASIAIATRVAEEGGLDARTVEIPHNRAPGNARNAGVARARGRLVWFCDADDTADPRFLSTLAERLERDGSAFAMCRTLVLENGGERVDEPVDADGVWSGAEVARAQLRNGLRGYSCNRLAPLDLVRRHPFPEDRFYEDYDPWLAMALESERVSLCRDALYHYHRRAGSVSNAFSERTRELFDQEHRVDRVLGRHPGAVGTAQRLRYRYEGVVFPVANMASRAPEHPASEAALREAASHVRLWDVVRLLFTGQRRMAVIAAELRISWRAYAAVLRRR